ncbi:SigB/SigF/SigG family RNA polymerase sigma factor [Nocardia sp. CA2R105]|uniref:SigB/SigF/SigG family RNA polymerase sigma factor n=1 Tax=Nocardia coffeae TaxID=2873381 RepID=UPI001CA6DBF4|nr:SigB/SigF/SigG family RNA polymerase sigma factor [Nocardia coffeae]MBY8860420.1 SigB/SigF/SigG family RNA polymerase sigma factor [Nocardia coffeae]
MTSTLTAQSTPVSRSNRGNDTYDHIEPWLEKMAALRRDDPERARLREQIIDLCLPLAEHITRRYSRRGENYEDLYQVAALGVVLAVDRFDPDKGVSFLAFAVPTIMGEVRRHFRDRTWMVRVPRPTKELQAAIGPATERLAHRLHRMPNASELAAELDVDRIEVTQALLAANAYNADTIDSSPDDTGREPTAAHMAKALGGEDTGYQLTEDALAIAPLLRELPSREREVLHLRFFENRTQTQIAEQIGVSQMQVSRILSATLTTLRNRALRE